MSGLRQGCVMPPWLFSRCIDGVVRKVYTRAERNAVNVVEVDGRGWELYQVLFTDDTALVAGLENKLHKLVVEFRRLCERRMLKVNVNKSKVMRCSQQVDGGRLNVGLGLQIVREGGVEVDISLRVGEDRRAAGTVRKLWKNGGLGVVAKMLYEGVVVPTALYGAEMYVSLRLP